MKGLVIALQFLTRLPLPAVAVSGAQFAASMRWYPVVGAIIGGLVAAAGWTGALIDPRLGALAALVVWVGVSGALHLDGLGDIADAAGALHKDRARLHSVLADPHVGSFAVTAIGLQLIAKLVLLDLVIARGLWAGLALAPFAARIGPLVWTCWLEPLHEGLASRFRGAVRPIDLIGWAALLLLAAWFVPALLVTPLLLFGWGLWLARRLGGISGDGHGAGIEIVEAGLLAALVIAAAQA
ncbi:adenosylcobinamide-GDP ribazoletransferase [Novosphingobium sp. PC22D]|uniref:adenosylcobinamide-GDP ribazoletransferase n=1 Tax=Novosphingobium sp. PC22D TaxID=1962403 RepID=UPI000BF067EA|nr:adenosylcobinamide-GDP ribazoletransferase [Novosphingobium sp. PC22D]PEQ13671.1 adenosylcobinamide-GDP ribazoletransferase [Novosphingobium sp. PC22D]